MMMKMMMMMMTSQGKGQSMMKMMMTIPSQGKGQSTLKNLLLYNLPVLQDTGSCLYLSGNYCCLIKYGLHEYKQREIND